MAVAEKVFQKSAGVCAAEDESERPTEYCSVGHMSPYIACVDDFNDMPALLAARAYRGEIILLMCDRDHLDMPLNAILTLRERGYEHYVLLMLSERDCRYAERFIPNVGCIWSEFLRKNPPQ